MDIINILNTCFTLCLAFTILFFIISVVLFFVFDIRTVFNIRSGRAQAKTVKEMQEANSNTGRLRVGKQTQTAKLTGFSTHGKPPVSREQQTTEQLPRSNQGADATTVLSTENSGADETQLLSQDESFTEVLNNNSVPSEPVQVDFSHTQSTPEVAIINFEVVKKVICRGTDEVIE